MIGTRLKQRARRVRHIEIDADLSADVQDSTYSAYFPARLFPPTDPGETSDGSPRESAAKQRLVWNREAPALSPGDRVELYGVEGTHELLSTVEPLRIGEKVTGYQAEVLELAVLYPQTADLDGDDIPLSLFTGSEDVRDHGDYETYEAECPIEFADDLRANAVLIVGDRRFRLTSSIVDYQAPHVELQLRSA